MHHRATLPQFIALVVLITSTALSTQALELDWELVTENPGWQDRAGHAVVVHDGDLWLLGGVGDSNYRDVWRSSGGENWNLVLGSAPWRWRWNHSVLSFDGKLWVIGGESTNGNLLNDVWTSEDGVEWTEATGDAPWQHVRGSQSLYFQNRMWTFPVADDDGSDNVYRSDNGADWTRATAAQPWSARSWPSVLIFDNALWLTGGFVDDFNQPRVFSDVWRSTDGAAWEQVNERAPWDRRFGHAAIAWADRMWVLGGYDFFDAVNDVWSSTDGVDWEQADPEESPWEPRSFPAVAVWQDTLWVLGGRGGDPFGREVPTFYDNIWKATIVPDSEGEGASEGEGSTEGEGALEGGSEGEGGNPTCDPSFPHSADINANADIEFSELLRVIQLYNAPAGYEACPDSEDGFCPLAL